MSDLAIQINHNKSSKYRKDAVSLLYSLIYTEIVIYYYV